MLVPWLFLALFQIALSQPKIKVHDPTKVDYCKLKCSVNGPDGKVKRYDENSGCKCGTRPKAWMIDYRPKKFRQDVIDEMNYLRNLVAGGGLLPDQPKASNMRAVSYSLEMEYIARCWAGQIPDFDEKKDNVAAIAHDKCRRTVDFVMCGQNIIFDYLYKPPVREKSRMFFTEYDQFPASMVPKFDGREAHKYGHYTEIVWANTSQMGCAQAFNPEHPNPYVLLCNYGGPQAFPNAQTFPVYDIGEPATRCPPGWPPNKDYPNLCGDIEPVPGDAPVKIKVR